MQRVTIIISGIEEQKLKLRNTINRLECPKCNARLIEILYEDTFVQLECSSKQCRFLSKKQESIDKCKKSIRKACRKKFNTEIKNLKALLAT